MVFISLTAEEIAAKQPVDDELMLKIKNDLDDLNSRITNTGNSPAELEVGGKLSFLNTYPQYRSHASMCLKKEFIPTFCRIGLKKSGISGALTIDLRKMAKPVTPITSISHQYSAATQSIGRTGSALNTQSIARATAQIATQSITHAKAALNIQSIVEISTGVFQYNLDAPIDSDSVAAEDSIVVAGATSGGNNGTFIMAEINRGNGNNFVAANPSGVAQTSPAGTAQVKIMSYNFTNPTNTYFGVGKMALFAAHTTGANNGNLLIYKLNEGGNNIWVKNPTGATQGGAVGTVDTYIMQFNLSSAAIATDYVVGESALTTAHTSASNDTSSAEIVAVNVSGDNLYLYIVGGASQAGVAGQIALNRWTYSMPTDPSADVIAGHTVTFFGHTSSVNNGNFPIKEVNRGAINNLVIYNVSGTPQAGVVGNVYTDRKILTFTADQSAIYDTASFIEMSDTFISALNFGDTVAPFQVLEVNRGGGANYNLVISAANITTAQAGAGGMIITEGKSLFNSRPSLSAEVISARPKENIFTSSTDFISQTIAENTPILLYVFNNMVGDPQDLIVSLT